MAGVVQIEAGGRKRPFRFKYKAIKNLAADLGVENLEDLPEKITGQNFKSIEAMLYHGFKAGAEYQDEKVDFDHKAIEDWLEEDLTFFKPALVYAQEQLIAALTGPKIEAGNKPGK